MTTSLVLTQPELTELINHLRTVYEYQIEEAPHGRGYIYGAPDPKVSNYQKRFYGNINHQETRDAFKHLLTHTPKLVADDLRCRALLDVAEARIITLEESLKEQKRLCQAACDEAGGLKVDNEKLTEENGNLIQSLTKLNIETTALRGKLGKLEGMFEDGQAG